MIQVKRQALSPGVSIAGVSIVQVISSMGLPGLSFDADPPHRTVRRFHTPLHSADGVHDIFGPQAVAKIEADRYQDILRALVKRQQFPAITAAVPANAAKMTFLDPCAAMALPPLREYLTR